MGSIGIHVDRDALNSLDSYLGSIEDISPEAIFKGLETGGQIVLEAVREKAPERTGRLKQALRLNRHMGSNPYVDVRVGQGKRAGARYWYLVEYGHGGPKPAPAHPFVEPATNAVREEAEQAIIDEIVRQLQ